MDVQSLAVHQHTTHAPEEVCYNGCLCHCKQEQLTGSLRES